ncbi:MAG: hypothetical protein ACREYE_30570 [Gammaproteobacteria bacterium]
MGEVKSLNQFWNALWFKPGALLDLAILRIAAVACQLFWTHIGLRDNLEEHSRLPDEIYEPLFTLRLLTGSFGAEYRPSLEELSTVWFITLIAGVLSLIGFFTNINLLVFAIGSIFLQAYLYAFGELHHTEAVMMIALLALALSPAGRTLSIDSLIHRFLGSKTRGVLSEESPYAGWPIRLIQWFFVLMYLSAFSHKMYTSGLEWMNGTTLQYYLVQDSLRNAMPLGLWLSEHHTLVKMLQWMLVSFQLTFVLAVIFPMLRWIYVPMGLSMHFGILFTLNAPFIQWIVLYVVFIPWHAMFRRWFQKAASTQKVYS